MRRCGRWLLMYRWTTTRVIIISQYYTSRTSRHRRRPYKKRSSGRKRKLCGWPLPKLLLHPLRPPPGITATTTSLATTALLNPTSWTGNIHTIRTEWHPNWRRRCVCSKLCASTETRALLVSSRIIPRSSIHESSATFDKICSYLNGSFLYIIRSRFVYVCIACTQPSCKSVAFLYKYCSKWFVSVSSSFQRQNFSTWNRLLLFDLIHISLFSIFTISLFPPTFLVRCLAWVNTLIFFDFFIYFFFFLAPPH